LLRLWHDWRGEESQEWKTVSVLGEAIADYREVGRAAGRVRVSLPKTVLSVNGRFTRRFS
jgi:hypothetical protein